MSNDDLTVNGTTRPNSPIGRIAFCLGGIEAMIIQPAASGQPEIIIPDNISTSEAVNTVIVVVERMLIEAGWKKGNA